MIRFVAHKKPYEFLEIFVSIILKSTAVDTVTGTQGALEKFGLKEGVGKVPFGEDGLDPRTWGP